MAVQVMLINVKNTIINHIWDMDITRKKEKALDFLALVEVDFSQVNHEAKNRMHSC